MLRTFMSRLLGFAVMDLDACARAMADRILEDYADILDVLEPEGTKQSLRTQYMRLVTRYGLPGDVANEVADRAWKIIADARGEPDAATSDRFAFYD